MIDWLSNFGWIKRRKVRIAVKREVRELQIHLAILYGKIQTASEEELEILTLEYEGITKKLEEHITFLVITRTTD
ncbi:MAG: hypothetical protein ABIE14_03740 [Patescibacteria group bacterium]